MEEWHRDLKQTLIYAILILYIYIYMKCVLPLISDAIWLTVQLVLWLLINYGNCPDPINIIYLAYIFHCEHIRLLGRRKKLNVKPWPGLAPIPTFRIILRRPKLSLSWCFIMVYKLRSKKTTNKDWLFHQHFNIFIYWVYILRFKRLVWGSWSLFGLNFSWKDFWLAQ